MTNFFDFLLTCETSEFFYHFLHNMDVRKKNEFVNWRRNEIMLIEDPDKLRVMCECGYMIGLIPLLGLVSEDEILNLYKRWYPKKLTSALMDDLTVQEEIILLQYAASHLEIAKYLREETDLLLVSNKRKCDYQRILYSTSTKEVCEYFFEYLIKKGIAINYKYAKIFFRRCSKDLIERYAKKIGKFDSSYNTFNKDMSQVLLKRNDLTDDEKYELFECIIKNFKICGAGFYDYEKWLDSKVS